MPSEARWDTIRGWINYVYPIPDQWVAWVSPPPETGLNAPTTINEILFKGEAMLSISYRIMDKVLSLQGLPTSLTLENLPDAGTMGRIRDAVTVAQQEMTAIIHSVPLVELENGFTVYIHTDGHLSTEEPNGVVYSVGVDYANYEFPIDVAKARLAELLPNWAEAVVASSLIHNGYDQLEVVAKAGAGAMRSRAIDLVIKDKQANGSWYRRANFESFSDGIISAGRLARLAELSIAVKHDYIRVMRKAFRQAASGPVKVETHDTFDNFDAFMSKRRLVLRNDPASNTVLVDRMPILPHGTTVNLTWGIEVESGGARGVSAPSGWDGKSDSSLRSAYTDGGYDSDEDGYRYIEPEDCDYSEQHQDEYLEGVDSGNRVENPDWLDPEDCDECGSVYIGDEEGEYGDCREFVSPILRSFHSQGLEKLVGELIQNPQNNSAGVHVHVGAKHLSPKQIGNLVLGYQLIEPLIEASYQRSTREYCRERPLDDVAKVLKISKTATQLVDNECRYGTPGKGIYTGDRYHSLNLQSLYSHGTVEFRAMGPVYNYESLIKWASFVREMVNCAANGAGPRDFGAVKDWNSLMALFAKFGVEYAKAEFNEIKANTPAELSQLAEAEV